MATKKKPAKKAAKKIEPAEKKAEAPKAPKSSGPVPAHVACAAAFISPPPDK